MQSDTTVQKILGYYESDNPGTKANLARILMQGRLGGTGKLLILPVDQGFEHGPTRSFAANPAAYDPRYFFELALEAGLSAYAAPLGSLEAAVDGFAGRIPLILKANSANSLSTVHDQAVTATVKDALRLGCSAIGFTIYFGAEAQYEEIEEVREAIREAKAHGLAVVVWAYPRGGSLSKEGETAIDVVSYGAHMAALLGAHIIKVNAPTDYVERPEARAVYEKYKVDISSLQQRIAHVVQCAFDGRRIVVFSGGAAKDKDSVLNEVRAIHAGGGFGSIIGRNSFQRPRAEALDLLDAIIQIYGSA
jgi:class I fructose-bisphosphate aldolase